MDILDITTKQLEILILLFHYRFLDRYHIQQLLNHKEPRRVKAWLKDLYEKGYIGKYYSPKVGLNTPAVYYLVTKSKSILEKQPKVDKKLLIRIYREKERKQRFIDHCLLLADVNIFLSSQAQENDNSLHFFTKTDLSTHYYLPYKRPDAYIALEEPDKTVKRYFVEIIDEGTPRFMMRKKIEQYLEYYESDKWQDTTNHPFPSILIVCPNETIKNFLRKHISQVLEEEGEDEFKFFLTTKQSIKSSEMKTNIWIKVN